MRYYNEDRNMGYNRYYSDDEYVDQAQSGTVLFADNAGVTPVVHSTRDAGNVSNAGTHQLELTPRLKSSVFPRKGHRLPTRKLSFDALGNALVRAWSRSVLRQFGFSFSNSHINMQYFFYAGR